MSWSCALWLLSVVTLRLSKRVSWVGSDLFPMSGCTVNPLYLLDLSSARARWLKRRTEPTGIVATGEPVGCSASATPFLVMRRAFGTEASGGWSRVARFQGGSGLMPRGAGAISVVADGKLSEDQLELGRLAPCGSRWRHAHESRPRSASPSRASCSSRKSRIAGSVPVR